VKDCIANIYVSTILISTFTLQCKFMRAVVAQSFFSAVMWQVYL